MPTSKQLSEQQKSAIFITEVLDILSGYNCQTATVQHVTDNGQPYLEVATDLDYGLDLWNAVSRAVFNRAGCKTIIVGKSVSTAQTPDFNVRIKLFRRDGSAQEQRSVNKSNTQFYKKEQGEFRLVEPEALPGVVL